MLASAGDAAHAALSRPFLVLLWLALWSNLNTGPWNLREETLETDPTLYVRALVPWVVLPFVVVLFVSRLGQVRRELRSGACFSLLVYGLLVTFFSIRSPEPMISYYYDVAFLCTVLTGLLWTGAGRDDRPLTAELLPLNWAITGAFACIIVYVGRGTLFSGADSAYGIINELEGQSRASGVARFCAVPALIGLCRFWRGRGFWRVLWLPLFLFFGYLVYLLQSRGAIFGVAAAFVFVVLLNRGFTRGAVLLGLGAAVYCLFDPRFELAEDVWRHLQRGQSSEEFASMTGRTRAWENAWKTMEESGMLLGYGNWADRALIGEHVHNTFLQAWMFGGLLGLLFFVWAWVRVWLDFRRVFRRLRELADRERDLFLEAGAILAFFTVRSIPETTNAGFSVDLLVLVPIMVYVETLAGRLRAKP